MRQALLFCLQVDVNTEVGVVRDIRLKELRIYTDYGRCSRPLFIVEKQRLLIKKKDILALQQRVCRTQSFWHPCQSDLFRFGLYVYGLFLMSCACSQESPDDGGWHDLVSKGFIEYIDTEEEETTMISMTIHVSNYQTSQVFPTKIIIHEILKYLSTSLRI